MAKTKFQVRKKPEEKQVLGNGFEKKHTTAAKKAEVCVREKCRGSITIVPATDEKGTKGFYWEVTG